MSRPVVAASPSDAGNAAYFTPLYSNFRTCLDGTFCCGGSGSGNENTPRYN